MPKEDSFRKWETGVKPQSSMYDIGTRRTSLQRSAAFRMIESHFPLQKEPLSFEGRSFIRTPAMVPLQVSRYFCRAHPLPPIAVNAWYVSIPIACSSKTGQESSASSSVFKLPCCGCSFPILLSGRIKKASSIPDNPDPNSPIEMVPRQMAVHHVVIETSPSLHKLNTSFGTTSASTLLRQSNSEKIMKVTSISYVVLHGNSLQPSTNMKNSGSLNPTSSLWHLEFNSKNKTDCIHQM